MAIHVSGLIAVLLFYLLILFVGVAAAWWKKRRMKNVVSSDEIVVTGGRELGYFVGIFTMTATWVGGGYINATVEVIFLQGLIWCQVPIGYAFSLIVAGILFAGKFREAKYITMLDPFQARYGRVTGGTAYLPALLGEVFWSAAILKTLGTTMSVILGLDVWICVAISAAIAIGYTLFGGLFSVAFTDVVQLLCIMIGISICIPFIWHHKDVHVATDPQIQYQNGTWRGEISTIQIPHYIDLYLLLIFGGIPWQVYFQRALAARTVMVARVLSICGGIGCLIMSIPCIVLGVAARYTNWTAIAPEIGLAAKIADQPTFVLPALITYLPPAYISFFGLGAVAAAVMSSSDSSLLSSSSMLSNNIYRGILRPGASSTEVIWVWRFGVVLFGVAGAAMGIKADNVYKLFYLCSDFVYVVLFPQLLLLVYAPFTNRVGYISGYLTGLLFRLLSGEEAFGIPAVIKYPLYHLDADGKGVQGFPHYTFCMLLNLVVTIVVSLITNRMCPAKVTRRGFTFANAADRSKKRGQDDKFVYETGNDKEFAFRRTVKPDSKNPQYEVHELSVNYR